MTAEGERRRNDRPDLRGAVLGGANLSEAILLKADLSGANLGGADLREADRYLVLSCHCTHNINVYVDRNVF